MHATAFISLQSFRCIILPNAALLISPLSSFYRPLPASPNAHYYDDACQYVASASSMFIYTILSALRYRYLLFITSAPVGWRYQATKWRAATPLWISFQAQCRIYARPLLPRYWAFWLLIWQYFHRHRLTELSYIEASPSRVSLYQMPFLDKYQEEEEELWLMAGISLDYIGLILLGW